MPKISIITPVYCDTSQKVDWLDEMIESVSHQTMTDWEIILINDKSPLPLDYVKMKHAGDSRLRWFENAENFGPAKTRNTAVALAESECILPLDSDDMLADNEVLEFMYDAWLMDNTKIIYGNVKLSMPGKKWHNRTVELLPYTIENVMNLSVGVMPVTCMHSKECHYQTVAEVESGIFRSGWKAELNSGREDLEYWIAAAKRGFCGLKINHTTLVYRRHEQSRDYRLKFELKELDAVQQKIKSMHSDIYNGRFPVACCGKNTSSAPVADPAVISQQNQSQTARVVTTLEDDYDKNDLEWIAYRGPKQGSSGSILTRGPANTPSEYPILGNGHVFQIHKVHRPLFEQRQKLGYVMNEPDPRKQPEPETSKSVVEIAPQITEIPHPEMSTIVRLDQTASQTREVDIQPFSETESHSSMLPEYSLSDLELSKGLTDTLSGNGWAIGALATTTPQTLSSLPGIGITRANNIIAKAQELINKT